MYGGHGSFGRVVDRRHLVADLDGRRERHDRLRGAFGDEEPAMVRAVWPFHDDGDATSIEVERNLVEFSIGRDVGGFVLKKGRIERTSNAGLEPAVQTRELQRPVGGLAQRIDGTIELHHPCGQRAGLVAAQHVDAAEILNRREMLDDDLLARHAEGALRQRDRCNHGKKLGCQADAEGYGKQQRFEAIALEREPDQHDEQDQDDRRTKNQETESSEAVFELGLRRTRSQSRRDLAEQRVRAGGNDDRRAGAADDGCTEKDETAVVRAGRSRHLGRGGHLVGRQRLPCQRGLLNREIARLEQPAVSGHEIPGGQADHVSRRDRPERNLLPLAVTEDGRRRRHRGAQPLGGLL